MVTSDNLDDLRAHGHGYIVGRNRRRSGEVFDYIQSATGPWIECPAGITAREKASAPKTLVQEVTSNQPGVRVFIVHSDERLAYERAQRVKAMERVRARLEKLAQRVAKGQIKAAEKIGAAAARILARNHGHRYYDWSCEDGVFRFFEHPVHFTREQAYEGKYVIQSEEADVSAFDAVRLYKDLTDVERAFANLKDVIELRPIYHRTDARVEAHIFVAALAFLLHRAIEKKLKAARLDLSATEALTPSNPSASSISISATAPPSARSPPARRAPPPCSARSASPTARRQPRRPRAKPSCSDKPTCRPEENQWLTRQNVKHGLGRNKRQRIAPTQGHCAPNRRRAPVNRRNQEIAPYALRPSVELRESELQLVLPT